MSTGRTVYQMRVEQIIDHTPTVRELVIKAESPERFVFKAGQFITLHVPHEPKPALRAYSIASDERDEQRLRLLFKYVENGVASTFIWKLQGQELLNVTGPFGRVLFKEPPSQQILFLNTGTGLSQHFSYLVSKKER
jgi:CDP-4-dehydro-6-deoxyglucose reductase